MAPMWATEWTEGDEERAEPRGTGTCPVITAAAIPRELNGGRRWSTAHERAVLGLFGERVLLVLAEEERQLGWWDHEAAAVVDG